MLHENFAMAIVLKISLYFVVQMIICYVLRKILPAEDVFPIVFMSQSSLFRFIHAMDSRCQFCLLARTGIPEFHDVNGIKIHR